MPRPAVETKRATAPPVAVSAGTRPNTTLVATAIAIVKASTRQSTPTSPSRGMLAGPIAISARVAQNATTSPATPPARPSTTLSARNCCTSRQRPAPSAARTATSRVRPLARASSRLATFTQATRRTSVTAPSRISSAGRMFADDAILQPDRGHHAILVGAREVSRQACRHESHRAVRLAEIDARLEARDGAYPLRASRALGDVARFEDSGRQ